MNKLKHTSELVRLLLLEDERCRNSDSYLYLKVVDLVAEQKGIDLKKVTIPTFLLELHGTAFPPFETVRRARQKVQAVYPELCPSKAVKGYRAEQELIYKSFAVGDV